MRGCDEDEVKTWDKNKDQIRLHGWTEPIDVELASLLLSVNNNGLVLLFCPVCFAQLCFRPTF